MVALVLVLAAAGFGAAVERALGLETTRLERLALAAAVALTAAPWFLFLGAWAFGYAAGLPLAITAMTLAGIVLGRGRWRRGAPPVGTVAIATSKLSWFALGLLFAQLFHGHMLHDEPFGWFTGGFAYSDMPLHAHLVHHFSSQTTFSFESPMVAGTPLTYPFLGDFLVASLVRGGWSTSFAFTITNWLSIMTMLALVQAVALRMFGRSAAATLAAWFVVVNGSIGGLWYLAQDLDHHGLRSLAEMPNYAHLDTRGFHSSNLTTDFYLPQRAILSALPAFWMVVWLLQAAVRLGDAGVRAQRPLLLGAVIAGLLPMLSVHSFFVLSGLMGWFAVWRSVAARRPAWSWLAATVLAIVVASPQLVWQFGQTWNAGFGKWNQGWMAPDGRLAWLWFWLRNWGVALPLVAINLVVARRLTRASFAMPFYTGLLVVFVAANLYQFQPNVWDNMKFLVYSYMAVALLAAGGLAHWLAAGGARRVAAAVMVFGMTATGAVSVMIQTDKHDQVASRNDLKQAGELARILPSDAVVLTADNHNHVVPMLTGRRIVMAYRGWLWTHGIDYVPIERDVRRMFAGGPSSHLVLRRRHVTHVYIGPVELRDWGASLDYFRSRYPSVYAANGVEVFDVRKPPTRVAMRSP